jgi:hypothetical protein
MKKNIAVTIILIMAFVVLLLMAVNARAMPFGIYTSAGGSGSGDMQASTYDPAGKSAQVLAISDIVTTVGTPGSDASIPSEQAVREALAFESGTADGQMLFWDTSAWKHTEIAELIWDDTLKHLGIGDSSPSAPLDIADTGGAQLRLAYNDTYYGEFEIDSAGEMLVDKITALTVGTVSDPAGLNVPDGKIVNNALTCYMLSVSLADEAYVDLPTSVAGWGKIVIGDTSVPVYEWANFHFEKDATVSLESNSGNVKNADADAKVCIFDNGSNVRISNRLGSTLTLRFSIWYSG